MSNPLLPLIIDCAQRRLEEEVDSPPRRKVSLIKLISLLYITYPPPPPPPPPPFKHCPDETSQPQVNKDEPNLFCTALRVMMMHHHTKFGCIQFSGLEDIFRAKV